MKRTKVIGPNDPAVPWANIELPRNRRDRHVRRKLFEWLDDRCGEFDSVACRCPVNAEHRLTLSTSPGTEPGMAKLTIVCDGGCTATAVIVEIIRGLGR